MSLYISLTGLKGAQTSLSVTSNNIANANSTGFKRSTTSFSDVVAQSGLNGRAQGTGTALKAVQQQMKQGIIETTGNTFDLALSGDGFFAVKPDLVSTDTLYTRAGEFRIDENNFIRGTSGQYLLAYPVNADGRATSTAFDALRPLQLPASSGNPVPSSQLQLAVNLPADGIVVPDQPRYLTTPYAFDATDPRTYNVATSATLYDSEGNPQLANVYYVRTKGPDATDDTSRWNVHVVIGLTELTPSSGAPELVFDDLGRLSTPAGPFPFAPYDPGNGADPIALTFDPGTATSQVNSPFTVFSLAQDGVPPGRLDSVTVDETGVVRVGFSNGEALAVGKVAIARFADPAKLAQIGNASYRVSGASGAAQFAEAGQDGTATMLSGSLERANVDITEELVNLITAQRNFQANAKAIETDNAMTQSIINIRN
jgi:flagellar hook protein FlgE